MNSVFTTLSPPTHRKKGPRFAALLILVTVIIVGAIATIVSLGQTDKAPSALNPGFQMSAYGYNVGGQSVRGCYIIDTQTGELWLARGDEAPKKISEKLR